MYKLLIVEDEDFIREAVVHCINWAEIGFEVRDAPDGEIALQIAKEFVPDALLTDIRMPFIDGLELIKQLSQQLPQLETVVLSGHDEFDYAQEALKSGVMDYLVKPIRPQALKESMRKLKARLDLRKSQQYDMRKLRIQCHNSLPLLREQYLNRILLRSEKEIAIRSQFDFLEINLRGTSYIVCLLAHTPFDDVSEENLMRFAIQNILQEELQTDAQCFCDTHGNHVAIYCARTEEKSERTYLTTVIESAKSAVENLLNLPITASIGTSVLSLCKLPDSYQSALDALDQQVILGKGRIYDATDYLPEHSAFFFPHDMTQSLLSKLKLGPLSTLPQEIKSFFGTFHTNPYQNLKNLQIVFISLINGSHKLLMEVECPTDRIDNGIYMWLFEKSTLDELEALLSVYLLSVRKQLDDLRQSKSESLIHRACEYIKANFTDPSLSLVAVAQSIYITPTYLSILFKRELSTTFVDFVTALRMERAKELLRLSELKTYEIAAQVGYKDPQYFSTCFKRYTHQTPSEYKAERN